MGTLRPLRSSENKMFTFLMLVAIARSSVSTDAICTFAGDGNGEVTGEVHLFNAHEDSETEIHGAVFGLNPGLHGFHIHAEGDLGDNCKNALGHFNPAGVNHGAPGDEVRHIGDLGKIEVHKVKMSGADSVIGKAIVIHADMDDLGRGGDDGSITTGNAGARVACCVITEIQTTPS